MKKRIFMYIAALCLTTVGVGSFSGVRPALAAETTRLSIGTAGTTGAYYMYGGAIANIISKHALDITASAEVTGGSVENIKLIGNKKLDLATVTNDVLNEAVNDYKNSKHFKKKVELKALFNMYTQPLHLVALANSDVKNFQDIKGKRVAVGSPGSGTEVKTRMVLHILGMEYKKDITPEFLSFAEASEALQDKTIDAFFMSVALPSPALASLTMTNPVKLIPLSDSEVDKINKAYPFLTKSVIPAKTYKGVDTDTQVVSVQSLVVCRADLPDDVAYKIVKAVFEHKNELDRVHNSFRDTTLANATPTLIPLHPGAIKYFKEKKVLK